MTPLRALRRLESGLALVEVELPDPGPDEVRVRVRAAGICGSDLHAVRAGAVPATLGHEVAGLLDDDTPVAVWPITPCERCARCLAGEPQQCPGALWGSYGYARDGGIADAMLVRRSSIVPLPEGLPVADACLVEPLACAVHGARRAGLAAGQRVAVVGGGTIGLVFAAVALARGCDVDLEARHPRQREAALALGARLGARGEYDLVVDAAGSPDATLRALALCRTGATLLLLATYPEGLRLPPHEFAMNEISLVPAAAHGRAAGVRDVDAAAALLAASPHLAPALVTHRLPLDAALEAFRIAGDRRAGAIKVVLEP